MREHTDGFGPQPCGNQVLVVARWKVYEPVNASAYASDATDPSMVRQQGVGIAGSRSLACREEPFLGSGDVVERLPCRFDRGISCHSRNLSYT